jgi:hypothetical protein
VAPLRFHEEHKLLGYLDRTRTARSAFIVHTGPPPFVYLVLNFLALVLLFFLLTINIFKSDYALIKLLKISPFKTDEVERRAML